MKLSARNQLTGTVTEITPRRGDRQRRARRRGPAPVASITVEAVDELGLAGGQPVTAIVKASTSSLAID